MYIKKHPLFLCIFSDIVATGLIPVNALLISFNMPEFVCAIAAFMVIASVVWFFMNSRGTLSKISVSFFALLAVVISILGSYCNPYWNSISYLTNADYDSKPYLTA